jgi:uncharacterized membrane protein (UPF0182 family)
MMKNKRPQLLIGLAAFLVFLAISLASQGAWGFLVLILVAGGIGATVYILRRRGIWPREVSMKKAGCWVGAAVVLVLILLGLTVGVRLYADWLWFDQMGYGSIFGTRLLTKTLLFFGTGILVTLFIGGNLRLALRWLPKPFWLDEQRARLADIWYKQAGPAVAWVSATIIGLIFAATAQNHWMRVLRFTNSRTIGEADPFLGHDLSFYLFRLHLLLDLKNALLWLSVLTLGLSAAIYALGLRKRQFPPRPLGHLSILGILFLLVKAWDYQLKKALLLYSQGGAAYGAGYTDVHARSPAYSILTGIVLACAVLLLINLWRRTWTLLAVGGGIWIISLFLLGTVYPALIQNFRVRPSELSLERPYIERSITYTLKAYGLDQVEEQNYPVEETLTQELIRQNPGTIENIRLWDHRPLYDTYGQLQEIRLYYDFVDVDVERYTLGGKYREVEMAVRELSVDQLSPDAAGRWVNRHLIYTHGYGVVLSPVNQICAEGQPCFLLRDIPPVASYPELQLDRPEVYFGEATTNYIIVGTTVDEFDYPSGDQNVFTRYEGSGGIPLKGFFRRLAFALYFGDAPILFSDNITPDSRILFRRTLEERVETIAPFLWYDYDPYPVILDGKLWWLQDAYTVSDRYPYAEPVGSINYIRNAVKIVIDPYNGTTTFYIVDPDDPIVQTYARIFPDLFQPVEEMPAGLRDHWRYPEDLFRIQTQVYSTYHMRDPQVFFNQEDVWNYAKEIYEEHENFVDSYYVIMRLPGWEHEEFFLMVPFTPANRDNMIAWMHVQCDGDDYGKLGVFKFPKQVLVYGPFQIEARINQDASISQQLSLWNQRGSQVLRGNLLVVPIENNLLYVEPLYLQAETGQIPELKRVTVAYGNHIAMEETLEEALKQVLSGETAGPEDQEWQDLARSADDHYQRAQECLQQGDWTCYGEAMEALEATLRELVRQADEP